MANPSDSDGTASPPHTVHREAASESCGFGGKWDESLILITVIIINIILLQWLDVGSCQLIVEVLKDLKCSGCHLILHKPPFPAGVCATQSTVEKKEGWHKYKGGDAAKHTTKKEEEMAD